MKINELQVRKKKLFMKIKSLWKMIVF
jgi:hypothetical protein